MTILLWMLAAYIVGVVTGDSIGYAIGYAAAWVVYTIRDWWDRLRDWMTRGA